jgi:hypothetical protein
MLIDSQNHERNGASPDPFLTCIGLPRAHEELGLPACVRIEHADQAPSDRLQIIPIQKDRHFAARNL